MKGIAAVLASACIVSSALAVDRSHSYRGFLETPLTLEAMLLDACAGMELKGDVGVLRGTGGTTVARTYWSNKATAIVSDVPSEAELKPANWGVFDIE